MTAHNLESRRSRGKLENSYVVRCGARYAYGISSPFFFNEWLEKHGIMRNWFQKPKLQRQPEESYS